MITLPRDQFAAYLANWARARFDLPHDAPAYVQHEALIPGTTTPDWFVTVEEGPHTETFWLCSSDLVWKQTWRDRFCAHCGEERGANVEMVDDIRGDRVVGRYLVGCEACVAHAEKDAAE